jgi:hypothetical protein
VSAQPSRQAAPRAAEYRRWSVIRNGVRVVAEISLDDLLRLFVAEKDRATVRIALNEQQLGRFYGTRSDCFERVR